MIPDPRWFWRSLRLAAALVALLAVAAVLGPDVWQQVGGAR